MGGDETEAIYTDSLSLLNARSSGTFGANSRYKLVTYPKGSKMTPLAYEIGSAYISAKASNPEACYRWLSTIARHPELFAAMPARQSLLDSPGVTAQGADVVAFYKQIAAQTNDPGTVIFPAQISSINGFVLQHLLNRVFDRYVLENADLEAELKQAQGVASEYQTCTANFPTTIPTSPLEQVLYIKQFSDCALKVDPSLKSLFGQP